MIETGGEPTVSTEREDTMVNLVRGTNRVCSSGHRPAHALVVCPRHGTQECSVDLGRHLNNTYANPVVVMKALSYSSLWVTLETRTWDAERAGKNM